MLVDALVLAVQVTHFLRPHHVTHGRHVHVRANVPVIGGHTHLPWWKDTTLEGGAGMEGRVKAKEDQRKRKVRSMSNKMVRLSTVGSFPHAP